MTEEPIEHRSMAEIVAAMSPDEREQILAGLDMDNLEYDWDFWGRPAQLPPKDRSWYIYALVSGRGFGKSRAGAQWVHRMAMENPGCRIALVGRTAADVRDVMVGGESGLLGNGINPAELPNYMPSTRAVHWPNGSQALCASSEEPSQLRGPQFHFAWADEVAAWRQTADDSGLNSWDNLVFATRLGDHPQLIVTTTPKRTKLMFDLIADAGNPEKIANPAKRIILVRGSTMDNASNLSHGYLDNLLGKYEGTRLAKQELHGLMLDPLDGALWEEELIEAARIPRLPNGLPLTVIAVDPTVAETQGDECGIVVMSATRQRRLGQRHCFLIEDASFQATPAQWANRIVDLYDKYQCPVVYETNQGGAVVKLALHQINPNIPVYGVHASKGKKLRAEPVTLKYDQKRVHHIGHFPELESQMTGWIPDEKGGKSPDRLDALVYAVTALAIDPPPPLRGGGARARSFAKQQVPGIKTKR